jgi:quercetin 2,3-dioxygenase
MITVRESEERGHFDHGWLDTYHSFSFAGYYDARFMGFRSLRVINEDRVHPGRGFMPHDHHDMEIITVILSGALEHKDSMGNGSVIRPGEVQRMSAGKGITHSEFNGSTTELVHLLQIWILPERRHLEPSYEQKAFPLQERQGRLQLLASRDGADGSVMLHQDVRLYASKLSAGDTVTFSLPADRHAWLQTVSGKISLNDIGLEGGDGAMASREVALKIAASSDSEFILFDLA